ncbi:unnamed protein product [Adineta steineri]|nr:unnamed protein product [Adineta steineri]
MCSPSCENGGTCVAPNACLCTSSYTDSICGTPVCSPSCENGGTCVAPNTCLCTSSYTDSVCGTPVCSPTCQNGGTCSASNTCTPYAHRHAKMEEHVWLQIHACVLRVTRAQCAELVTVCSSTCQNGGTCSAPNTCTCTTGYQGSKRQQQQQQLQLRRRQQQQQQLQLQRRRQQPQQPQQ